MPGPFPGIDPYLEAQGYWPDFRIRFLSALSEVLNDRLPGHYEARMDERFTLIEADAPGPKAIEPDIALLRRPGPPVAAAPAGPGVAVLEPRVLPIALPLIVEERQVWIEVRRLPDRAVVAVIELLSPTNKSGAGWQDYVERRNALLLRDVHLVELDFLVAGRRMPLGVDFPDGDYHAIVGRVESRPNCHVYSWTVRQPLPRLPFPLRAPDPDIEVDLAAVYATAHERGRYLRSADYRAPPEVPLSAADRAWAEGVALAIGGG